MYELLPFIIVLVFSVIGFTDAFYSMNKALPEDSQSEGLKDLKSAVIYSVMNTFGEFDIDGFGDIGMLIFFLATFINLIILLNLVVAIVCEVFNEYNAMRLKSFY